MDVKDSSLKRIKVLEWSLNLELISSLTLAYLLDIENSEVNESKSFGNSSSALSFNQKVNLLLDNKSITKEDKLKLESFMNIRNQFIHNSYVISFVTAVEKIVGLKKRLEKLYPENFKDSQEEESLEKCTHNLYNDSFIILMDFKGGMANKIKTISERDVYMKKYKILAEVMMDEIGKTIHFLNQNESIDKDNLVRKLSVLGREIQFKASKSYEKEN